MIQTGVQSVGSRRQAWRNRVAAGTGTNMPAPPPAVERSRSLKKADLRRCSVAHLCGVAPLHLRVRSLAPSISTFLSDLPGLPRARGGGARYARAPTIL